MCILTVRITEAFGLPKPSLLSNYKVMLLLCHKIEFKFKSCDTNLVLDWLLISCDILRSILVEHILCVRPCCMRTTMLYDH